MDKINFQNYELKKLNPANSERAYWIGETAMLVQKPFKQIIGLTRDWETEWIKDMVLINKGKPALWWWFYKRSKI